MTVHLMCMFPLVIHSHDCVFYDINYCSGQQKTKQEVIPLNITKRITPPTKKQLIHFSFAIFLRLFCRNVK